MRTKISSLLSSESPRNVLFSVSAGIHRLRWDGTNRQGNSLASGIYIIEVRSGSFIATRKMVLIK
ncbi:MAG: hypothetical protein D6732_10820 [Methanobacteriota archaeon]|nr:MAG: hypothetical protein D6732_10820 [Euryarchaeota archaeon]